MPIILKKTKAKSELHELLLRACPPSTSMKLKNGRVGYVRAKKGEKGHRSIKALAQYMNLTPWAIYLWVHKNNLPPNRVRELVFLSNGGLKIRDFDQYVFF